MPSITEYDKCSEKVCFSFGFNPEIFEKSMFSRLLFLCGAKLGGKMKEMQREVSENVC
jgi:hypothetical protein